MLRIGGYPRDGGGASAHGEWKTFIAIAAKSSNNALLPQESGDPHNVYTNDLIDNINNFDKAAIVRQAREFKL